MGWCHYRHHNQRGGGLKTSVAFSGDCSTWSGVLKGEQYGQAKITPGGRGRQPTVQRGWIMLGGAKPVRVEETAD